MTFHLFRNSPLFKISRIINCEGCVWIGASWVVLTFNGTLFELPLLYYL